MPGVPNKSHMFLPSPFIDFSVQCLDSLPPYKIYRPKVEGWPHPRQHLLLPVAVLAKTPAHTFFFFNLYFSSLCSFSSRSQITSWARIVSLPQKSSKSSTTSFLLTLQIKIQVYFVVSKAQKKLTLFPELICVEHDKGHWCLQICVLTLYLGQVNPVPRDDVVICFICSRMFFPQETVLHPNKLLPDHTVSFHLFALFVS